MILYKDQLIIITGGAGFIGSGLIRYLNEKGITNIIVVDELGNDERWKNLVGKQFIEIITPTQLWSWLEGKESFIKAIIHLGACSDTMETNATYLLDNNTKYSIRLAEYALKNEIRFIYASSAATYGDGSKGFSDEVNNIFELQPLNMYGFSKQLFDQWVVSQGALNKVVGLKYFNVYGPNEYHKGRMSSAICKMVPEIVRGQKVRLFKSSEPARFGDGEQQRDFLYVKDAAKMTHAFLDNLACGIFNVGGGEAITWNRLAKAVYKALGKEPEIEYIPMPDNLIGKYQNYSCADMKKTKKAIKKAAECMNFESAVDDYVKNYLVTENRW